MLVYNHKYNEKFEEKISKVDHNGFFWRRGSNEIYFQNQFIGRYDRELFRPICLLTQGDLCDWMVKSNSDDWIYDLFAMMCAKQDPRVHMLGGGYRWTDYSMTVRKGNPEPPARFCEDILGGMSYGTAMNLSFQEKVRLIFEELKHE